MNKELIPNEESFALRELGFDFSNIEIRDSNTFKVPNNIKERLEYSFNDMKDANLIQLPLYQQAFRWFREKHNMLANVYSNASGFLFEYHDTIGGTHRFDSRMTGPNEGGVWDTYEEAELSCLKKLIKIVKNKHV
jgi:hypothetical protein